MEKQVVMEKEFEKEFVTYELSLRMKALDYDEPCMAIYSNANPKTGLYTLKKYRLKLIKQTSQKNKGVKAPTWQSAFRWFREKYELHSCIHSDYTWNISGGIWDLNEHKGSRYDWDYSNNYSTYEEAELSCLEKLMEIVKTKTE
jgi:hypothetical protein